LTFNNSQIGNERKRVEFEMLFKNDKKVNRPKEEVKINCRSDPI
jgi:hypothetical protein